MGPWVLMVKVSIERTTLQRLFLPVPSSNRQAEAPPSHWSSGNQHYSPGFLIPTELFIWSDSGPETCVCITVRWMGCTDSGHIPEMSDSDGLGVEPEFALLTTFRWGCCCWPMACSLNTTALYQTPFLLLNHSTPQPVQIYPFFMIWVSFTYIISSCKLKQNAPKVAPHVLRIFNLRPCIVITGSAMVHLQGTSKICFVRCRMSVWKWCKLSWKSFLGPDCQVKA